MDNIEITVFDEIKDYKEKIYFFNFRQWVFAILIAALVIPTYILLKDKICEEATSYIVIAIAGSLGFIGFVKIHELPAEKILPYWFRHYFLFAKPIHYMSDEEYRLLHDKKNKGKVSKNAKLQTMNKKEIKELRKKQKQEKLEEQGFEFLEAEVRMVPTTTVELDEKSAEKMQRLLDNLDDLDDVLNVYHNWAE